MFSAAAVPLFILNRMLLPLLRLAVVVAHSRAQAPFVRKSQDRAATFYPVNEKYAWMTTVGSLEPVLAEISAGLRVGLVPQPEQATFHGSVGD